MTFVVGTHVNSTTRSYIRSGNQYQVPPDVRFESGSPNGADTFNLVPAVETKQLFLLAFSDYTHAQAHAYPSRT